MGNHFYQFTGEDVSILISMLRMNLPNMLANAAQSCPSEAMAAGGRVLARKDKTAQENRYDSRIELFNLDYSQVEMMRIETLKMSYSLFISWLWPL